MEILPDSQPQANGSQIQAARPCLANLPIELLGQVILHVINQPAVYIFDLTFDNSFRPCFICNSLPPSGGRMAFHPICSASPHDLPFCKIAKKTEKAGNEQKEEGENQEGENDVSPMALEKRGTYEPQSSKTIRALIAVNRFCRSEVTRHLNYISVPTATNRLNKVWFNPSIHVICIRNAHICPVTILELKPDPWTELNFSIEHLGFLHSNQFPPVLRIFSFMLPDLKKLYSVLIDHQAQAESSANDNINNDDNKKKRLPLEPIFPERQLEFYSPVHLHMFKRHWALAKRDLLYRQPPYPARDAAGRVVRAKPFIQNAILQGLILR